MNEIDDDQRKLIANERAKLTATYLNGLAVALVAVGGFAPAFSGRPGVAQAAADPAALAISLGFCIVTSGVLHLAGRTLLGRLR